MSEVCVCAIFLILLRSECASPPLSLVPLFVDVVERLGKLDRYVLSNRERLKQQIEEQRMQECTFSPAITARSLELIEERAAQINPHNVERDT